ncbi:DinB family protein [Yeosuana sp. MJ-SS3]|uniref:DinB family protein n=1 Tax=Gilvirhabdus luticola TaxID=3079858 RepID=A0ABU3U9T4_9FLAO|nr:DinB family protein [Yeosuana sp. MJ-SS3]MDU8887136.1 DinB family protein [Yeosuana sp. MJ-SS3]
MEFNLQKAILILERTPAVLDSLLRDLPKDWTHRNEGENTWSPFDVVGHLLHGEKTDWIERTNIILQNDLNISFTPFDRFAQFEDSKGKTMNNLLDEFSALRNANLKILNDLDLSERNFTLIGRHPNLGKVTLKQLLASWVAHDLGHIAQITRVMAKQYKNEVGPWKEYMSILNK